MHLRWQETFIEEPWGRGFIKRNATKVLQQFWIISDAESDLTLPKERGPDGEIGRWRDVLTEGTISK